MHVPDLDHRKVITLRRGELTTTPRDITDVFGTTHALVLRRPGRPSGHPGPAGSPKIT